MDLGADIFQYQPNEQNDWLLLDWLNRMRNDGDLDHTLSDGVHSASAFLLFFRTRPLFVKIDSLGNITHAVWLEFTMGSVFLSFYVHPGHRHYSKNTLFFLLDIIDKLFDEGVNCIAGVIQERATPEITDKFIRQHERLGYQYSGRLPDFFDGKDAHIVSMSASQWENFNGWSKKLWRQQRQQQQEKGQHRGIHGRGGEGARHRADIHVPDAENAESNGVTIYDAVYAGIY